MQDERRGRAEPVRTRGRLTRALTVGVIASALVLSACSSSSSGGNSNSGTTTLVVQNGAGGATGELNAYAQLNKEFEKAHPKRQDQVRDQELRRAGLDRQAPAVGQQPAGRHADEPGLPGDGHVRESRPAGRPRFLREEVRLGDAAVVEAARAQRALQQRRRPDGNRPAVGHLGDQPVGRAADEHRPGKQVGISGAADTPLPSSSRTSPPRRRRA